MLSRVHRRIGSRVAAALVAVALSGIGSSLAQMPRSPDAHVCRCPKGDHDCTCPVCRAASAAARARKLGSPPCHRPAGAGEEDTRREKCCVSSACHLPEAVAAIDGREVFTLVDGVPGTRSSAEALVLLAPAAPPDVVRLPEVPPPRAALRS